MRKNTIQFESAKMLLPWAQQANLCHVHRSGQLGANSHPPANTVEVTRAHLEKVSEAERHQILALLHEFLNVSQRTPSSWHHVDGEAQSPSHRGKLGSGSNKAGVFSRT